MNPRYNSISIILSLILTSSLFVLILLYYTHGALLYGGDGYGFYSDYQFLQQPDPNSFVFAICYLISFGNYYVAFYVFIFTSTFVTLCGVYFVTNEIFRESLCVSTRVIMVILAGVLYIVNPVALTDTFKSLIANIYLYNAAFLIFLGEVIRLWRSNKRNANFNLKDALVLGISLGISAQPFPNNVRTFIVGSIIFAFFLVLHVRTSVISTISSEFLRISKIVVVSILGGILGAIYSVVPMLENFEQAIGTAQQGAINQNSTVFVQGSFNTLPQVFRLLGTWAFSSGYVPYNSAYFSDILVVVASFLWPLLALGLPLLRSKGTLKEIVLPIEFLMIVAIFWEKASNPPLGILYDVIISHIYFGSQLIPTYFLSQILLSKLYSVMASYSIVSLYFWRRESY